MSKVAEATPPAPEPEAQPEAPRLKLIEKHPLALRWMHWINFPVLMIMIWSGILILWAYPEYPTEKYALPVPNRISLSRKGITFVLPDKDEENYPVPANKRKDIATGFRLAEGMAWHFTWAWFFTLNGVAYVLYLWISGEGKYLLPKRESFRESFLVVLKDVWLYRKPLPPGKYNHAQRIAYTAVIVMSAAMIVTGLAIYKPAQLTWLASLLGGYQMARKEHFVITALLVAFFFVHVTQVAIAGWNNFRGMITGYELARHDFRTKEETR